MTCIPLDAHYKVKMPAGQTEQKALEIVRDAYSITSQKDNVLSGCGIWNVCCDVNIEHINLARSKITWPISK